MKVAFDSRPVSDSDGVGRYSRCLLAALRETAATRDELVETHRPSARTRVADVFHAPWMDGAMLHSPCPMVVTIHDLAALKRRSERLRSGGLHLRLRRLALQRATHVIVPDELVADEVVAELGLEREHVVVIPPARDATAAHVPACAPPAWSWEDAARATWGVYARAAAPTERSRPVARARVSTRRA
ncbi:MAG TPA: glycosyltransferase [Solirubrobacteraceae bacterium]|nr:glycosyltransferase [Solirubrobacteraceae bacterium]